MSAAARLASLHGAELDELHAGGSAPVPDALTGVMDGVVLTGRLSAPVLRSLRLWRGKVFDRDEDGTVVGVNRLGIGPLEVRRYPFAARVAASSFGEREVILLDHDVETNPPRVRRFHDELVEIEDGLYLATSHHRRGGELRYLCHFALAKTPGGRPAGRRES